MRGAENLEMKPGTSYEENAYANVSGLELQTIRNATTDEAARSTQYRVMLILGVLLILSFIALVILTSFLFISYKIIGEEILQMRNGSLSSEVQSSWTSVKNLEQVQSASTYFSSDIQRIMELLGKVAEDVHKMKNSSDPLCSEGWIHYGLSCYYLSSKAQTWNASKKDCEDRHAHLMVINGEREMNFLRRISKKQFLWIGLTDMDGTWRWVDGTPYDITPKFWMKGQPDDWKGHGFGGGEDCAALRPTNEWNDGHCSEIIKYVCEKEMIF